MHDGNRNASLWREHTERKHFIAVSTPLCSPGTLMQHVSKCLCTATISTKYCGTSHVRMWLQVKIRNSCMREEFRLQLTCHWLLRGINITALDRALLMEGHCALALHSHHMHVILSPSFFIYRFPSCYFSVLLSSVPPHPDSLGIKLKSKVNSLIY